VRLHSGVGHIAPADIRAALQAVHPGGFVTCVAHQIPDRSQAAAGGSTHSTPSALPRVSPPVNVATSPTLTARSPTRTVCCAASQAVPGDGKAASQRSPFSATMYRQDPSSSSLP
jgi:hypothetical protein